MVTVQLFEVVSAKGAKVARRGSNDLILTVNEPQSAAPRVEASVQSDPEREQSKPPPEPPPLELSDASTFERMPPLEELRGPFPGTPSSVAVALAQPACTSKETTATRPVATRRNPYRPPSAVSIVSLQTI
jgi:hypothetical protein